MSGGSGPTRRRVLGLLGAGGAGAVLGTGRALGAATARPGVDLVPPTGWDYPAIEALLPFGHGVVSGDPLPDRVNLWTRITIPDARGWTVVDPQGVTTVDVSWVIARDPELRDVLGGGTVVTDAGRDWTVCVDAGGLPSATSLYYGFTALGVASPVGRTRTAPGPDEDVPLVFASVACTSWWHDLFNGYRRIAERDDVDLIVHSGDHVYDNSGGHPAVRAFRDRFDTDDIDARDWDSVDEMRRRYALYYSDPAFLAAHRSAPIVVLPDNHDVDDGDGIDLASAARVFWEWTASRPVSSTGDGTFLPPTGPDVNRPIPDVDRGRFWYRVLPYGRAAQVVVIDTEYQEGEQGPNGEHELLGDQQWAWLQRVLLAGRDRGVRHNVVVNQKQMGQLRFANLPLEEQALRPVAEAIGVDVDELQSGAEFYPGWGKSPESRRRLVGFLRTNGIVDNVVLSGDSHGWFAWDLVEDNQLPAYEPSTGGGTLGAVGVELVPSAMGRPGGQDSVAEAIYANGLGEQVGSGDAFSDGAVYREQVRPLGAPPILALEAAAQVANPNLRYFDWRTYGHGLVGLDPGGATLELWSSPPDRIVDEATLLRRFRSPLGAPHLGEPLGGPGSIDPVRGRAAPTPVRDLSDGGPLEGVDAGAPTTTTAGGGSGSGTPGVLPATGGTVPIGVVVAALAAGLAARRARPRPDRRAVSRTR